jgi:hypothetical protein
MSGPTFGGKSKLIRHIAPDERRGRYASPSAFLLNEVDKKSASPYLSVNSTEVESLDDIVETYRERQSGGEVAVSAHNVYKYVEKGRDAGAVISSPRGTSRWSFAENGNERPAFSYRKTDQSASHCGVEFLRALDELQQRGFARLMARFPKLETFDE